MVVNKKVFRKIGKPIHGLPRGAFKWENTTQGSPCFAFPIFLKLFPKATKLGSLFPKVQTDLSTQTNGRLHVRTEKYQPFYMQTYVLACKMETKIDFTLEATLWLLSKQPRSLNVGLDLSYKVLKFCG